MSTLNVRSMDHVTLVVSDVEASRQFYVGLLGLREVERPAFDFDGAWFQCGPVQIHVTLSDENSGLPGWADRNVGRASRGHHFAFQVDDVPQAVQLISNANVQIVAGPKGRPDGATQVYVADPDGHLVELFSV